MGITLLENKTYPERIRGGSPSEEEDEKSLTLLKLQPSLCSCKKGSNMKKHYATVELVLI